MCVAPHARQAMTRASAAIEASSRICRQAAASFDEEYDVLKKGIDQMVASFGLDPTEFH
jgi:hypothetical protein